MLQLLSSARALSIVGQNSQKSMLGYVITCSRTCCVCLFFDILVGLLYNAKCMLLLPCCKFGGNNDKDLVFQSKTLL